MDASKQQHQTHSCQVADRDLQRRIVNFLFERGLTSLRHLKTEVHGGVAMIKGQVRTYYEKQLATCCCQRVAGVLHVINDVRVLGDAPAVPRCSDAIQKEQRHEEPATLYPDHTQ